MCGQELPVVSGLPLCHISLTVCDSLIKMSTVKINVAAHDVSCELIVSGNMFTFNIYESIVVYCSVQPAQGWVVLGNC